jgi:DNA-binding response OmpR family regulator
MEHPPLAGYSILLVEANPRVASDLGRALEGSGARIFIASSLVDARFLTESAELSGAVLDYTQSIRDGHEIAIRLRDLAIPFVFCKDIGRNEAWPHAPVLNKPFSSAELVDMLRRMLGPETAHVGERLAATSTPEGPAPRKAELLP